MDLKKNFQSKSAVNLFLKDFVNYIKAGHCIFLLGDLGVGKTYFSQQIIKSFTSEEFVSSPTYNIVNTCLLYTSPSPRDLSTSRMPSSA